MLAEIQVAALQGAKAKVRRLCVQLARNGRGVKGRYYTWQLHLFRWKKREGGWSHPRRRGMSAQILPDSDPEECFEAPSLADLNKEATARKDLQDTSRLSKKSAQKERSCPGWSAPSELFIMALDPLYFAVRDSTPHGLGFDKAECTKLTQAKDVQLKILVQGNSEESLFLVQRCAATFTIRPLPGTMPRGSHGHRAVTVRLRTEGIQHLTDFEDLRNAFRVYECEL